MTISNASSNLKTWAQCNLNTQHLSADDHGNIKLEKGSAYEVYGWAYNSLLKNPCGCSPVPSSKLMNQRQEDLIRLINSFITTIFKIEPKEISAKKLNHIDSVYEVLVTQLDNSHIGYKTTDRFKGSSVKNFNHTLGNMRIDFEKLYNPIKNMLSECNEIKNNLEKLAPENKKLLNEILDTYTKYEKKLISSRKFQEVIDSFLDPSNVALNDYLKELKSNHIKNARAVQWIPPSKLVTPLKPPTDHQTSIDFNDCIELYKLLDSYFPSSSYMSMLSTEKFIKNIQTIDEEQLMQLCDDLMTTALRLSDNIEKDLREWGQNDSKIMTAILVTQRAGGNEFSKQYYKGEGTYLYKAFFQLFNIYRLIASLHVPLDSGKYPTPNTNLLGEIKWREQFFTKDTIQYRWRMDVIERQQRFLELLGKDNLEEADDRFLFHFAVDKIENKPQSRILPTPT